MNLPSLNAEWLETDGLGGFASSTVSGIRTRRYHALLLVSKRPPADRVVLVNGMEVWIESSQGKEFLSAQRYAPDVIYPRGLDQISAFAIEPWPVWSHALSKGVKIRSEIFAVRGRPGVVLRWEQTAGAPVRIKMRPLMSGRDYHGLHRENPVFHFGPTQQGEVVSWQPYGDQPVVQARTNGFYLHSPDWFRNFLYSAEQERGLDDIEDLASPGVFSWDLGAGPAAMILSTDAAGFGTEPAGTLVEHLAAAERTRRNAFPTRLHAAADAYIVRRGEGKTLIAGYPWFTDWGRDTFISLRGLCLSGSRQEEARDILVQWAGAVSEGMVPNRFPDGGEAPEFNSVDASLWYVVAVGEYLRVAAGGAAAPSAAEFEKLKAAVQAILKGYSQGTRYGIRLDDDGLLAAGQPGYQLTWMDARVDGREITPRIGKPVEIQALWLNALQVGSQFAPAWLETHQAGLEAFHQRFWNAEQGCLFDVVDNFHQRGANDAAMRPNQILAVGGLPSPILEGERAAKVVEAVEALLWTPMGLRSLAPGSPGYVGHYGGSVAQRDGCYHQGTVWPWLAGAFIEAWVRVEGGTPEAKRTARERFLQPLLNHLKDAGLGHVSEIADGDSPFTPRGCPFQGWSLGELMRLELAVLAE